MEREIYDIKYNDKKGAINKKHGINMIAVTDDPAIMVKGLYFNNSMVNEYQVMSSEQKAMAFDKLKEVGQEVPEHWKKITVEEFVKGSLNKPQQFKEIESKFAEWTLDSSLDRFSPDGKGVFLVRYSYGTPPGVPEVIETSRSFCKDIVGLSRVYSYEEINSLNNPQFGNYSIFDYKGSYGCRHRWNREYYFVDLEDDVIRRTGSNPISRQVAESVDDQATEVNPKPKKFSAETYKMRVAAPAMIPDIEIPRIDEESGDIFYVTFTAEEIEKLWSNFQSKNVEAKFNVDHTEEVAPAYLLEGWIIETEEDKAYSKYGFSAEELPIGSLFIVTQFTDFEFFMENIVEKKQYGYSVEGFFDIDLKLKQMKEKNNEEKYQVKKVEKYELDGKFYTIKDGKLELMEEEEKEEIKEEMETKPEEEIKEQEERDEVREKMEEDSTYYSKEEIDQKLDSIVEMIAKLEGAREEKEEVVEEKEDFKSQEEKKEDKKVNNTIASKFEALSKLINKK